MNVKKNDTVVVLSGKDKGKQGKVIVEGVSVATRHQKARRQGEEGGIVKKETPIYACKVMTVCPKCNKATRVAHKIVDGKKVRVCKHCGAEI
jgi:large subunit ribosomal protein L24